MASFNTAVRQMTEMSQQKMTAMFQRKKTQNAKSGACLSNDFCDHNCAKPMLSVDEPLV